ncbi:MAG: hypothetical protein GXO39_03390 [Thermotogae bacterium]|nr:hypothetical protein [Thermotogota bacterium]
MKRLLITVGIVLATCRYPYPPEGRVGTYVWSSEMWADTLDSCVSYIDSVYKGTDKLGPGVKSGVVWLVRGDVSDTACLRFGDDPDVFFFKRDDRLDALYRRLFFNYDTASGEPIVGPGDEYSLCAAIIINAEFRKRWSLPLIMPYPPDSQFLDSIPDTLHVGGTHTIRWASEPTANSYMLRLIGYDDLGYYCYVEIITDTPEVSFQLLPYVPGYCILDGRDSLRVDLVNLYLLKYDEGDMFGETRSMGRITKWVRLNWE